MYKHYFQKSSERTEIYKRSPVIDAGGKPENPGKNIRKQVRTGNQIRYTYSAGTGNRTRAQWSTARRRKYRYAMVSHNKCLILIQIWTNFKQYVMNNWSSYLQLKFLRKTKYQNQSSFWFYAYSYHPGVSVTGSNNIKLYFLSNYIKLSMIRLQLPSNAIAVDTETTLWWIPGYPFCKRRSLVYKIQVRSWHIKQMSTLFQT